MSFPLQLVFPFLHGLAKNWLSENAHERRKVRIEKENQLSSLDFGITKHPWFWCENKGWNTKKKTKLSGQVLSYFINTDNTVHIYFEMSTVLC